MQANTSPIPDGFTRVRFNYYSVRFNPYANLKKTSTEVFFDLIEYINKQRDQEKKYVVLKRYEKSDPKEHREMFINYCAHDLVEKKLKFSIALNRNENPPWQKDEDTLELIPLKNVGKLYELTYFYIDYSRPVTVMCVQYKHSGARFLDIIFYLRLLAKNLNLAHALLTQAYTDKTIKEALQQVDDVLRIKMSMRPDNITYLEMDAKKYYQGMVNLQNSFGAKVLEFQAFYQDRGSKSQKILKEKNSKATNFFISMLKIFDRNSEQELLFENFEVDFKDKLGEDLYFNLLKDKSGFEIDIDFNVTKKVTQIYLLVLPLFNEFLNERNP